MKRISMVTLILLMASSLSAQDRYIDWVQVKDTAAWQPRDSQGEFVFKDKMWIIGDWYNGRLEGLSASNMVWSSTDGVNWTKVTDNAGWSPRVAAAIVEFKGKLWILGGTENYYFGDKESLKNDVWSLEIPEDWFEK